MSLETLESLKFLDSESVFTVPNGCLVSVGAEPKHSFKKSGGEIVIFDRTSAPGFGLFLSHDCTRLACSNVLHVAQFFSSSSC